MGSGRSRESSMLREFLAARHALDSRSTPSAVRPWASFYSTASANAEAVVTTLRHYTYITRAARIPNAATPFPVATEEPLRFTTPPRRRITGVECAADLTFIMASRNSKN